MLITENQEYYRKIEDVRFRMNIILHTDLKDVHILVSDNIISDYNLLENEISDESNEEVKGILLIPNEIHEEFIILISHSEFDSGNYLRTLIHEFTHADDFIKFGKEFCNGNFKTIKSNKLFCTMHMWTEFHAYYNSNVYEISCLKSIGINIDEREKFNDFFNRIRDNVTDIENREQKGYYLFAYLGNYASCNLYDDSLNNGCKINQKIFKKYDNQKIIKLYTFLFKNIYYPKENNTFYELDKMLRSIFLK